MKTQNRIVTGLIMASLIFAGSVFAESYDKKIQKNENSTQSPTLKGKAAKHFNGHNNPFALLAKFQFENMAAQTISELSSKPLDTVVSRLKEIRLPEVLREYNIKKDAFQTAIKPKLVSIINKRAEDGSITATQKAAVLEAVEKHEKRQEVMEKLVHNGIKNRVITREDADRILPGLDEEPPAE